MIKAPILVALIAAVVAVFGYLLNHYLDRRKDSRLRKLQRLESQLQDFYGPLMALSHATYTIYDGWIRIYRDGKPFNDDDPPTEEQLSFWRTWITSVLQPLNERMVTIVIERSHLLDDDELPGAFSVLLAHVEGYKPIIAAWKVGDYSRHLSIIDYPSNLHEQIRDHYKRLSSAYADLLKKD